MTSVGFLGFGYAVPPHVRNREDPVFDRVNAEAGSTQVKEGDLFTRLDERRYLKHGESIEDLMVSAGEGALTAAKLEASQIDRLYGYSMVAEYLVPNGLFKVHQGLGLSNRTMVVPLNNGFTTFITGAVLAWEAILSGHCRHVMLNSGSGLTRNANYHAAHSFVAGDGAGAAILGPSDRNVIVDYVEETYTDDDDYHGINLKVRIHERHDVRHVRIDEHGLPIPTFELNDGGIRTFLARGMREPPRLARLLMERNGVRAEDVAFIGHQGQLGMMDAWAREIAPRQYIHTAHQFGNMTDASIPVTLATCIHQVETEYIVLASPGLGAHFAALLLRR